jgi:ABC-type iron transport system FetAB ATPase subunit
LNMMFGLDVQVKIEHKLLYNQFEFDIQTEVKNANGDLISGTHEDFGGSLTTIESLLLRVITILKFKMRRILLLDEFFGSLDHDRIEALGTLISLLVEKYQFDILCVTHDEDLAQLSHTCYEIQSLKKGVTFKKTVQKSRSTTTE